MNKAELEQVVRDLKEELAAEKLTSKKLKANNDRLTKLVDVRTEEVRGIRNGEKPSVKPDEVERLRKQIEELSHRNHYLSDVINTTISDMMNGVQLFASGVEIMQSNAQKLITQVKRGE